MIHNHAVYKPLYEDEEKFIILITGGRGCEHPDTPILMYDLSVKPIKDIKVGDKLLGDYDIPTAVNVIGTLQGSSTMYKVSSEDLSTDDYIVNDTHILTLQDMERDERVDIGIQEYLLLPPKAKANLWGIQRRIDTEYSRARSLRDYYYPIKVEEIGEGEWCGVRLDKNQRYLHSDGTVTHNSGKSFSSSCFIERLTFELGENEGKRIAHQILYTRYTMVSAEISVIPEFLEKVDADGTAKYFRKTKRDVTNISTGSTIMFRGIHTSSGNQTAKLKSIHGITTFVVDEAEEWVNENEFDTIMLSIRQKGLQNRIMIIMNPTDSNHFIYRRYIKDTHKLVEYDGVPVQISTHPNVLHIHTTYLDNLKHLSQQFLDEVNIMKEQNPEKYAHIVMGQWADVAEGAIFKKWGIVDEFPRHARNQGKGLDFGFASDPSACVRFGEIVTPDGVDLYLDEQFYSRGMLISDLIRELKAQDPDLFVYADSADPRLIEEISLGGVIIYGVQKFAGSIVAGIEKMKDYRHIFVTKRSVNLQEELRNYTWDKNKDGNYINTPIDAYNHACFVGETLITTKDGEKRIDEITTNDYVLTRRGFKRVINVYDNGIQEVCEKEIQFKTKKITLCATKDHKIFTTVGWKRYEQLNLGEYLMLLSLTDESTEEERGQNIIGVDGTRVEKSVISSCTMLFTNFSTAQYPKATWCIILMKTLLIILQTISSQLRKATICAFTTISENLEENTPTLLKLLRLPKKITKRGLTHLGKIAKPPYVPIVEQNFLRGTKEQDTAHRIAIRCGKCMLNAIKNHVYVPSVVKYLTQVNTAPIKRAHLNAPLLEKAREERVEDIKVVGVRRERVYDIEVEEAHEYFANGILVHNCDAARYGILGRIMGKVIRKEMKDKVNRGGNSKPPSFSMY